MERAQDDGPALERHLDAVAERTARPGPDAALIRQTLDQRDVLPRLTLLLADAGVVP